MATYMEYLHMQKPIPNNVTVTGVPVTLSTIDPNGNYVEIGTVTTDISGKFQFAWKPQIEGTYKVVANFAGDDSYGSSWDETGLSAGVAPVSTPTVTTNPNPIDVTTSVANYVIAGVIAIIIAIAVVGALLMLAIRRK
jgi:hypothetical protein